MRLSPEALLRPPAVREYELVTPLASAFAAEYGYLHAMHEFALTQPCYLWLMEGRLGLYFVDCVVVFRLGKLAIVSSLKGLPFRLNVERPKKE